MGGFWLRRKNFLGVEAYCILCPTSMSLMTDSYSGLSEVHRYLRRRIHLCLLRRTFPTRRLAGLNPKCFCIFKYQSCKCIVHWLARGPNPSEGCMWADSSCIACIIFSGGCGGGIGQPSSESIGHSHPPGCCTGSNSTGLSKIRRWRRRADRFPSLRVDSSESIASS